MSKFAYINRFRFTKNNTIGQLERGTGGGAAAAEYDVTNDIVSTAGPVISRGRLGFGRGCGSEALGEQRDTENYNTGRRNLWQCC